MAAPTKNTKLGLKNPPAKPTQNDLRRLMREKQQLLQDKEKRKIDSPLAKYNDAGKLFCALCNIQVKSELLWPAHVHGKSHKQNLAELKQQKQAAADKANFKTPAAPGPLKRPPESSHYDAPIKKTKVNTTEGKFVPDDFFDDKPKSKNIPSEDDDDDDDDEDMDTTESLTITTPSQVPPGFFETSKKGSNSDAGKGAANLKINSKEANSLPEGFFDDPIQDAKVRKVEYKDPAEEEWEKFQREIADATHKAQAIVDEEEEESTAERQLDEIEEQIHNWARVDALQRKKDELAKQQKNNNAKNMDEDSSADEQEFEEFLDWRSKGSWR